MAVKGIFSLVIYYICISLRFFVLQILRIFLRVELCSLFGFCFQIVSICKVAWRLYIIIIYELLSIVYYISNYPKYFIKKVEVFIWQIISDKCNSHISLLFLCASVKYLVGFYWQEANIPRAYIPLAKHNWYFLPLCDILYYAGT